MAELWTLSGINSYSPDAGRIVDYVGAALRGHVATRPARRYASELGTMPFYRAADNVMKLCAKDILDREARDFVAGRRGGHPAIATGMFRHTEVRCLVAAPKTTTPPPRVDGLVVEVYFNPMDGIPNQSLFKSDSKNRWRRYPRGGGSMWSVKNSRGRGLARGHDFRGFLVRAPRLIKRVRKRLHGPGRRHKYAWEETGHTAPWAVATIRDWLADPQVDHVLVGHSQGANIAMHLLRRGFA